MNERLKMYRKSHGLSQTEFAQKIGLIQATYSSYESGRYPIPDKVVKSICAVYKISEDWLRTGIGFPEQDQTEEERFAEIVAKFTNDFDDERKELASNIFHLLQEIPDEYLPSILKFSQSLVEAREAKKKEKN